MKSFFLIFALFIQSAHASNIHAECSAIYSVLVAKLNDEGSYKQAEFFNNLGKQHVKQLQLKYSDSEVYELIITEHRKIINISDKSKLEKILAKCFEIDRV